jgi:hypothetical protein
VRGCVCVCVCVCVLPMFLGARSCCLGLVHFAKVQVLLWGFEVIVRVSERDLSTIDRRGTTRRDSLCLLHH